MIMNARAYNLDSEHHEQVKLMEWAGMDCKTYPALRSLFAIPNGGHRHPTIGAQMKAEGCRPGVPDLMLPVQSNGYPGLFIEMKRRVGGRLSDEQKVWRNRLTENGYCVRVCLGWEEARAVLIEYLTTKKP
jgi:hypothetical protein